MLHISVIHIVLVPILTLNLTLRSWLQFHLRFINVDIFRDQLILKTDLLVGDVLRTVLK